MLYKIKTRKPTMSEGDQLIVAFMVLIGLPTLVCIVGSFFI